MIKTRKILSLLCCVLMIATLSTACSKKTSESSSQNTNNGTSETQNSSDIYGKVTAIDGKKITLALGDMPQGRMGGSAPSGMPSGKGNNQDGSASNNTPNGSGNGNGSNSAAPSGAAPSGAPGNNKQFSGNGRQGMGGFFKENGKTQVITVDDESLIKIQSGNQQTDGSLKDISVDSILTIQYDKNKKISAIIVHNNMPGSSNNKSGSSSNQSSQSNDKSM